jgi:hypothetical protein
MDFASTYKLESIALPGVVVTLRRMGPKRRAEVELSVSAARAKQRELSIRHESTRVKLIAAIDASPKDGEGKPVEAELRPECLKLAGELQDYADQAAALVKAEIHPAFVKAAFKSVGGPEVLTYDGKAATAELLNDCGPEDLWLEVVAAINANGYLSAKEAENLSLPTTSGAEAAGTANPSIAPNVKPDVNSSPAAA